MMEKEIKNVYELHEVSLNGMRELEFMKDEQSFLEHLLSAHFLELSAEELYEKTRKLIRKLKEVENMGTHLMNEFITFDKLVATSMVEKKRHLETDILQKRTLVQKDFDDYTLKFKYVKKKIFGLIKEILKSHKQRLLLE